MPLNIKDLQMDELTSDPVSPPDGCLWYNTTEDKFKGQAGGAAVDISGGGGSGDVVGPASAVADNLASYDTTTGKLIKDSGLASASVASMLAVGGTAPVEISASGTFVTTSDTYVVVTGMTHTPAAGTYLVVFTGEITSGSNNTNAFASIFHDGAIVPHAERVQNVRNTGGYMSTGTSALLTFNGSQAVDIRIRRENASAISATVRNRSVVIIRQS